MRLLFVIFVLSVAALIWMALAIARHIRSQQKRESMDALSKDLPDAPQQEAVSGSAPSNDSPSADGPVLMGKRL